MHPKDISIKDYTYHLPDDKIASYPLAERDASKLLIYKEEKITEDIYKKIAEHIPPDSLLIFNNTKVIEARLLFQKASGGSIEIFCLEPDDRYTDIQTAMLQQQKVLWKCLIGGASKWKHGQLLEKKIKTDGEELILHANYIEKKTGYFIVEFTWTPASLSFAEIIHYAGAIPLPPYIKRKAEASDTERYQTIYAHHDGSVAAPTAGLHFTDDVFKELANKKIKTDFITLHVGAGTFKPVKADSMKDHEMHAEFIHVQKETIKHILAHINSSIIAVGTTSLRTIESLYWLGVKIESGKLEVGSGESRNFIELGQWEAYDIEEKNISPAEALQVLLDWMENNNRDYVFAKTQIIIAPGYKLKIAKGLVTNFHQPQSTLLLLVAAIAGKNWRKIYDYALENNFRFLSYGDGCLIMSV